MNNIQGFWPKGWDSLALAFQENFSSRGETGASLSVVYQGEMIVSLWAGTRNFSETLPWSENTCANVFSAGKGLVAAALLSTDINIQNPVAYYWPEFKGQGKDTITVAQVLNHQSGLSAFHPKVKDPVIFNIEAITELIAHETPWWEPGSAQGYSPFIYGWILAEIIRRVSGAQSFDSYFQQAIAKPLGLQSYFGVPESLQATLADVRPLKRKQSQPESAGANSAALGQLMKKDPRGVTNKAFSNPLSLMTSSNSTAWRSAVIPAANCHTNARSLAQFYGAMVKPEGLLEKVQRKILVQATPAKCDNVLGLPLRFNQGFMLSQKTPDCLFGGLQGFGHPGAGGSLGFADPEVSLGFGYVTARMGQSLLIDERARHLINTVYTLLTKET